MNRLLWFEPFWILFLTPFVLLPGKLLSTNDHLWAVIGLMLFWPLHLLRQHRLTPVTPLDWPFTFILLWLPVTIVVSIGRAHSWEVAGYILLGVALYVALVNWPGMRRRPERIAWVLLGLLTALSLVGPLLLTNPEVGASFLTPFQAMLRPLISRVAETINPNILANALLVAFPLCVALALRWDWARSRWLPFAAAVLAVWLVAVIVLTGSRGSEMAIAVVLPILFFLRWPRLLYLLPLLLIAFTLGVYFTDANLLDLLSSGSATSGFDERVEIWQRAIFAIQDFSFTGVGLGMFNRVIPLLYPYFLIAPDLDIPDAHNLLLQVGVDLGMPGLIAYLAMLICLFVMLIQLLRRRDDALTWTLSAGLLGAFVAILIGGVFAAVNWGVKLAFVNWLLVALTVLLHRKSYEKTAS